MEAVAWITTFLGVMVFDVDIGLYIGIGFSLIMVIFKTQRYILKSMSGSFKLTNFN
jgi:hypothetical protein